MQPGSDFALRVAAVRGFNRFYTGQIGVLDEHLLNSAFSLTEVRVLYELASGANVTASELSVRLNLDAGYLSRILQGFLERKIISRKPVGNDARRSHLSLTSKGRRTFAPLEARANREVAALLDKLPAPEQTRLVAAMETIQTLLQQPRTEPQESYILRSHCPGDMGWIVQRHGALYHQEYGWDEKFEAVVAEITARFIQQFDPQHERCWIAEREGRNVGSVLLVKESATVARLRVLLVEPETRGLGIGKRLVDECIRFAAVVGYRKIVLLTQSNLLTARKIYENAGFLLVKQDPDHAFGPGLIAETWELDLNSPG